jgi:mRNA (2'-O-methyladenosine-N6-)-methyltransferase
MLFQWQSSVDKFKAYCEHGTKQECRKQNKSVHVCFKIHFKRIVNPHTESHLGDCSYLNTCHRMRSCKYMHYTLDIGYNELKADVHCKYVNPFVSYWFLQFKNI